MFTIDVFFFPVEHSRVRLLSPKATGSSDYINASYISVLCGKYMNMYVEERIDKS